MESGRSKVYMVDGHAEGSGSVDMLKVQEMLGSILQSKFKS